MVGLFVSICLCVWLKLEIFFHIYIHSVLFYFFTQIPSASASNFIQISSNFVFVSFLFLIFYRYVNAIKCILLMSTYMLSLFSPCVSPF